MIAWLFDKDNDDTEEENRHSATSASDCEKMAQNHNWELKRVEPTEGRILESWFACSRGHKPAFQMIGTTTKMRSFVCDCCARTI